MQDKQVVQSAIPYYGGKIYKKAPEDLVSISALVLFFLRSVDIGFEKCK